jgi:hypothetical protein
MEQQLAEAGKPDGAENGAEHFAQLRKEWGDAARQWGTGKPVETAEVKALAQRMVAALSRVVGSYCAVGEQAR